MGWSNNDTKFMRRALSLAQNGEGHVSPNPLVGAVLVKNGRIIGEGYHEGFGSPHAEVNTIRKAGKAAAGSTLYVTLEPCSHFGKGKKTPPCVPLIIKSGIKRVIIAAKDANPKVDGISQLKKAGLAVECGLLSKEAELQNEFFFHFMRTGKPFVAIKLAQSRNGKIGIKGKRNVRISGKQFDSYVQRLRNRYDSILVGINTVISDNPRLTCRMSGGRNPVRIILDETFKLPLNAKVLARAKKETVIIATSGKRNRKKEQMLKSLGVHILVCGRETVSFKSLLQQLPTFGITSVLIEGGAKTVSSALREKAADKIILAISPNKLPENGAIDSPFAAPSARKFFKRTTLRKLGPDAVIEACARC
jgi:diaminohydroxyphosphoribosylaminopyrimidine deaminase/5-amino-6-(5-phosphoribosylamino)uracil reductase